MYNLYKAIDKKLKNICTNMKTLTHSQINLRQTKKEEDFFRLTCQSFIQLQPIQATNWSQ